MARQVFIVGASSGIGYETAKKFLSGGDNVINMSRTPCDLKDVKNILCDVSDREKLSIEIEKYKESNKALDIFIYSAGYSMACPLEYVNEEDYRYLFEVNFFGFMTLLKAFLPLLRVSQGVAVVVSSVGGTVPIAYDSFYSASKAAVNMLACALSYELLPRGVKIISVMPGGTKTEFSFKRKVYSNKECGDYALDKSKALKNLVRIEQSGAKPSSVGNTIFRLCSNRVAAHTVSSGFLNKLVVQITRLMPQALLYRINYKVYLD